MLSPSRYYYNWLWRIIHYPKPSVSDIKIFFQGWNADKMTLEVGSNYKPRL